MSQGSVQGEYRQRVACTLPVRCLYAALALLIMCISLFFKCFYVACTLPVRSACTLPVRCLYAACTLPVLLKQLPLFFLISLLPSLFRPAAPPRALSLDELLQCDVVVGKS